MKVLGIITEYNPFHNGHKHHIKEAKKITGADYVIAVMSGDFVQRGTPAIISKYDRSLMALNNGVDLVLELPICYATGSAQYFALGAVALLNGLGIVDYICFGSESGNIKVLEEAAKLFINPTESFQNLLYSYIREGFTYPAARAKATEQMLELDGSPISSDLLEVISEPNNILGIEYIKALLQLNSSLKPFTIKRHKANYHDKHISVSNNTNEQANEDLSGVINSATAIRGILENANASSYLTSVIASVPKNVFDYFINNHCITYPVTIEDFSVLIKYKLMSESSIQLSEYLDLSSDIADRIKNTDLQNQSITELSQTIKTKNITLTRVNRALIHTLLNIKRDTFREYLDDSIIYYARVLGMKKEASHLIRKIKKFERLPVITKVSRADKQLDTLGMRMLNQDIFATHLYNQNLFDKYKTVIPNEYKHGICMI
ncbi:MAG: nucleotidyltransferase [Anaerolineaceae bacterium]|nr:MAG: nucleotidyltransferase [Anaerolineaceae bacterium]